jgi:hypothetical protein
MIGPGSMSVIFRLQLGFPNRFILLKIILGKIRLSHNWKKLDKEILHSCNTMHGTVMVSSFFPADLEWNI